MTRRNFFAPGFIAALGIQFAVAAELPISRPELSPAGVTLQGPSVTIAGNTVEVTAVNNLSIKSGANTTLLSGANLTASSGGSATLQSSGELNLSGSRTRLNGGN